MMAGAKYPRFQSKRDKSGRRFRVYYKLLYDGNYIEWIGYYNTKTGARLAIFWNRKIASWGGEALLRDAGR